MDPALFADDLVLTGPTASGKTAVGLRLAERLNAEIVSMDSMTLYRGMDIGTAKPSAADRARVPHHLLDALDPRQSSSLAWWLESAADAARAIRARGRRVLFVGGTPLYWKGLLCCIFEGPAANEELRSRLEREGGSALHARLQAADPASAAKLHVNDIRRLVRALEIYELTGRPMSAWQRQFDKPLPRRLAPLWLDLPRPELYDRINRRVVQMMHDGWLDEVRRLTQLSHPLSKEARQALGYKELITHLESGMSLAETVAQIQTRSRQFAKRQLTWFRNLEDCSPLPIGPAEATEMIADRVLHAWFGEGDSA
jgi:tRNA dimethylallyltransferase